MWKLSEETSKFLLLLWQPPALITASQPWGVCPSLSKELCWLPIKFCCQYKVAILARHHFNSQQQPSLSASLSTYQVSHTLWSSKKKAPESKVKKHKFGIFGLRSFTSFQFHHSNCLEFAACQSATSPHSEFKTQLKTCLQFHKPS